MSDSSSDDEPMISSPDESIGDDDDEKVFTYQARKFQKTASNSRISSTPPSASKRKSSNQMSTKDQMSLLERKKKSQEWKLKKRIQLDSDDDSVVEIAMPTASRPTAVEKNDDDDSSIEVCSPPKINKNTAASNERTRRSEIDLLDSSDEEEKSPLRTIPLSEMAGASKEAMEALQRSKQAKMGLERAQHYKAEDVYVETNDMDETPLVSSGIHRNTAQPRSQTKATAVNLGKKLELICRTQLEINGRKKSVPDQKINIRENEQLDVLLQKFLKLHSLPYSARVNMSFDGITLDMTKSPAHFEMMDKGLIDIGAKANVIPKKVQNVGPQFNIVLRRKMGKKIEQINMKIGQKENFSSLLDAYRNKEQNLGGKHLSLRFDGEPLDMQKTPAAYDMEADDLIDVIVD